MMKRLFLAAAVLVSVTLSFAQEYMLIENIYGEITRYDIGTIKQAYFMTFEATGSGTAEAPFNVAAANEKCKGMGSNPSEQQYYVKGYVSSIVRSYYGVANFYIADDLSGINRLYTCDVQVPVDGELKIGDEVVILASLYNYNKLSPEATGSIVTINGEAVELRKAHGSGTVEDPYNVWAILDIVSALEVGVPLEKEMYVKGYVTSIPNNGITAAYNNATFYISDNEEGNNHFYIYRAKGLGGGDITDENFIKVGDEVVICGTGWINYHGNTPETQQGKAYVYSVNGKTGGGNTPTPSGNNDGSLEKPFTPAEANAFIGTLAADTNTDNDYYIKGKIVKYANNGEFGTQYGNASFYISADGSESGEQFYVFRTLYLGNKKYSDDSWAKPKAGDEVIICGKLVNYKGNTPETVSNKSYIYSLNGKTEADGGSSEATAGADGSTIISVADFNAAAESTDVWYQLTGTVNNLKDYDQYGNFDLEDSTGSVYVYGLLSEKGGAKKMFKELATEKGIANGKKITIVGNRGSYNGKIEVLNAYFINVE